MRKLVKPHTPAQEAAYKLINQRSALCHWCGKTSLYKFGPEGACATHKDQLRPAMMKRVVAKDIKEADRAEEITVTVRQGRSRSAPKTWHSKLFFVG